ncbi:MAG: hypothetical protein KDA54_02265 [Phycisphaerales bacterium]|nr:hypothetical protein [Phycisphaerales bacterium]
MRVGLVTCKTLPEPDPDAAPLDAALRARGHTPVMLPWDDASTQCDGLKRAQLDLIVIRSPWNYFTAADAFKDWIERANGIAPVINGPSVVKWNMHKGYLLELAAAGVAIVPTTLIKSADASAAKYAIASYGDVVIKPAIGAGSFGAGRFKNNEASALDHATKPATGRDVLIQPYLAGFEYPGERSLVWINGEWTHAIRKQPRFAGESESVDSGEPPTEAELAVADAAIRAVPHKFHYARADLVETEGGVVLSELELMEPSLFFDHSVTALDRFIAMIESVAM